MRALEDLALNYDQKADALQAAYTEREKIEAELQRKDEHCVTLMNEIELLKEEKTEIQELIRNIHLDVRSFFNDPDLILASRSPWLSKKWSTSYI